MSIVLFGIEPCSVLLGHYAVVIKAFALYLCRGIENIFLSLYGKVINDSVLI